MHAELTAMADKPHFKLTKDEVHFEHPAKGENRCGLCVYFIGNRTQLCKIVAGHVEGKDWCDRFEEK
jgi:hypothetical protein